LSESWRGVCGAIDFKGVHYPKSVILHAVFFYLRCAVFYRDLEDILAERGVVVDHATLNRWVVKFAPLIAARAQARKRPTASSWRIDETSIKVKGHWTYLYRAMDRDGQTLDFASRTFGSYSRNAAIWLPHGGSSSERLPPTACPTGS
jgi:putative transposase